ncbi:MFS transporter [Rufibacter tibetensis]|uniref:MFS transporter n=1 Tax=Rufibacter tibetensis TaxID=512763 RepID=A0A0P0D097_9BACT|nr:MFS transporter [Rufibacter tibetensis]ALJ00229.1 MFS transporter [Rufibacter tibetensis]
MKASHGKATSINLFSLKTIQMRTFHLSWFAFFLCFFGWFGIAPLMAIVRDELNLSKSEIGNIMIASVSITIMARLIIGWLCDKIGPRISYTIILILGALPVMFIGFSTDYESFLLFRLAIGVIGASFVITQYHTTAMFAPNVVGTANATTAGWGNLGGGITQMVMPLFFAGFVALGFVNAQAWRYAMVIPGVLMILCGIAYFFWTTDYPAGNKAELQKAAGDKKKTGVSFWKAIADYRVWALFVLYGACFGIELTINNIAAIYYHDNFALSLETAGMIAGLFGLMNIFARTLGGYFGDKAGIKWGLSGRVWFLGAVILVEGLALMVFAQMTVLSFSIISLVVFSLFVQMAEGATFSVVPFINKKAMGAVAGVVGAGGNAGAVAAGFLFKVESFSYPQALFIIGLVVAGSSVLALLVRFSKETETEARLELKQLLAEARGEHVPAMLYAQE